MLALARRIVSGEEEDDEAGSALLPIAQYTSLTPSTPPSPWLSKAGSRRCGGWRNIPDNHKGYPYFRQRATP